VGGVESGMNAGIVPNAAAGGGAEQRRQGSGEANVLSIRPLLIRAIRYGLIGFGALTVVSAAVNIVGARMLIEVLDEAQLGFTRNKFILGYMGPAVLGGVTMVGGALWRRKG
jgi:hypothetical protein